MQKCYSLSYYKYEQICRSKQSKLLWMADFNISKYVSSFSESVGKLNSKTICQMV